MKMQKTAAFILLILSGFCGPAALCQAGYTTEELIYTGEDCMLSQHIATLDGGTFYTIRTLDQSGFYHITFIKRDSNNTIQWSRKLNSEMEFSNVVQSPDSGYFCAGLDPSVQNQMRILKLDNTGNLVFYRLLTTPGYWVSSDPVALARNNNGFYIACTSMDTITYNSVWYLAEVDENGIIGMSLAYHDLTSKTRMCDIDTCSNGDILLLGIFYDDSVGVHGPKVDRISPGGVLLWSRIYISGNNDSYAYNFVRTPGDFVYITSSYYNSTSQQQGVGYMKIDGTGAVLWSFDYSATGALPDELIALPGSITVIVLSDIYHGYMLMVDSLGQMLCGRQYTNLFSATIAGSANGDFTVAGTDLLNHVLVTRSVGSCGDGCSDVPFSLLKIPVSYSVTSDSGILFIPYTESAVPVSLTVPVLNFIQTCSDVGVQETASPVSAPVAYPSPASDKLYVESEEVIEELELTDVTGKSLMELYPNNRNVTIDISSCSPGIYFLKTRVGQVVHISRIMVTR